MRRFLIWSGLAVLIGLVLAVGGYLAYDHFYARFQPVTIARGQGEIQHLLDEASWVSPGGGDQPLYIVGFRDSPGTMAYQREQADALRAGGVDVRVLMFARPDREGQSQSTAAERATIAELWLTRDWNLYQQWIAGPSARWTAAGIQPADRNLARSAVVEASRQFVQRLDVLMRDAGIKPTWPLVIWRDREGFLKACACADSRSWAFVRDDLGASDAVRPAGPAQPEMPMVPAQPQIQSSGQSMGQDQSTGLPYPNLGPIPPATTIPPMTLPQTAQPPPSGATPTPPSAPITGRPVAPPHTPSRPTARSNPPRAATPPRRPSGPKPIPPEDTQFF
ncbi:hypothetical protein BH10PSE2_BH10PSE2_28690 [soil metagenome]